MGFPSPAERVMWAPTRGSWEVSVTRSLFCSLAAWAALALIGQPSVAGAQVPRCPNVLVVFDSSCSMDADAGAGDRYTVGKNAVKELTAGGQTQFRYGLELFGLDPDGCSISSPSCSYPEAGCQSVACDYNTADEIGAVLDQYAEPQGYTPTGPAITEAAKRADMKDTSRSRYIVLVTDGEPFECTSNDELTNALDALNSIRTNQSVKTFVLAFAVPSNLHTQLNQMAQAGGTARASTCNSSTRCYYSANTASELQSALQAIITEVQGEFGGTCDDTCYGQGCPAGSFCATVDGGPTCVQDRCAGVSCNGGTCVDGVCRAFCDTPCGPDERCENGQCIKDVACPSPCTGRNQVCVGGQCVEDYCSGQSFNISTHCPSTHICYRNNCQKQYTYAADAGSAADGGSSGGNKNSGASAASPGCCTGAPGAFSAMAWVLALGAFALRRRSRI